MSSRIPLFVELCAGTAAVSLRLHGGPKARPPVSRMGSKRGYAHAILWACGLRSGQGAEHYLWCEPDPGVRLLLEAYRDPELAREAAAIIRSWKDEEPRALWKRLRAEGPPRGPEPNRLAWFAAMQGGAVLALPMPMEANGPAMHPNRDPARKGGAWPEPMPTRLTERSWSPMSATITDDARPIEPADLPPGTVVYIDPPYVNTTGYGHDLPRSEVVAMACRWADAGALVVISEQEPIAELVACGWHTVEITNERVGQRRTFSRQQSEWLTVSEPPRWRPSRQASLFNG